MTKLCNLKILNRCILVTILKKKWDYLLFGHAKADILIKLQHLTQKYSFWIWRYKITEHFKSKNLNMSFQQNTFFYTFILQIFLSRNIWFVWILCLKLSTFVELFLCLWYKIYRRQVCLWKIHSRPWTTTHANYLQKSSQNLRFQNILDRSLQWFEKLSLVQNIVILEVLFSWS